MYLRFKEPKFHISVASLLCRDDVAAGIIVEVPDTNEKVDVNKKSNEILDIHHFSSKYCAYDSSDDEDLISADIKDKSDIESSTSSKNYNKFDSSKSNNSNTSSEILSCSIIECLIGNRIFRYIIDVDNKSSTTSKFKEVFTSHPTKKHKKI